MTYIEMQEGGFPRVSFLRIESTVLYGKIFLKKTLSR
jgi:hypothetical protein